jgi:hypothetical protein
MIFEFFKKKELHGARAPKRVSDHKPLKYERGLLDVFEKKKTYKEDVFGAGWLNEHAEKVRIDTTSSGTV